MAAPSPPDGALPPSSSTPPPPIPSSSPPLISIPPPPVLPPIPSPPIPDPPPIVPSSPPPTTPPPVDPATPPPTSPVLPPPPPAVPATLPLTSPVLPPPPPQSPPSPPILPPPQPPPSPSLVPPPKPSPSPLLVPPPKPSPSPPITPPSVTSPPPPAMVSPPSPETPPPSSSSPPRTPPIQPEVSPPPNAQPPQDSPTSPVSSPGTPVRLSPPPPANSTKPLPVSPPAPFALNYPNSPTPTRPLNSPPVTVSNSNSGGGLKTEAIIGIGAAVVIIVLLGALIVWCLKSKKKDVRRFVSEYVMPPANGSPASQASESTHQSAPLVKSSSSQGYSYSPREPGPGISKGWFTYKELSAITDDFSSQNILGEGGFGCVYKGRLPDGRDVAVKQLKVGGGQGEREFQAEVEIISRVHHRHLVSLVGYCISENQRLLVYDYVPNNTLHYHLHGHGSPVMDWATRIKIAAGAARGIAYLHEDCHPRIIHRDIKSSNILLDNSFEALVSDFGLAKLTVDAQTHVTTRVMGTFGYMAPEYASSGKLTDRSDVFSFGVVLLELITGRKPVDTSQPVGDESLVQWARPLMSCALETGDFDGLPDPRLQGNHSEQEMLRLIEIAAACVRHSASMRPQMGVVVRALDNLNDNMDLQNGVRPGQSELFNTGPNSEDIRIFNMMAFGGQAYTSDFSHSSWSDHREF